GRLLNEDLRGLVTGEEAVDDGRVRRAARRRDEPPRGVRRTQLGQVRVDHDVELATDRVTGLVANLVRGADTIDTLDARDVLDVASRHLQRSRNDQLVVRRRDNTVAVVRLLRDELERILQRSDRQRRVAREDVTVASREVRGAQERPSRLDVLLGRSATTELTRDAAKQPEVAVVDDGLPRQLDLDTVLVDLQTLAGGLETDDRVLTVLRDDRKATRRVSKARVGARDILILVVPRELHVLRLAEVREDLARRPVLPDLGLLSVVVEHDLVERRSQLHREVGGRDALDQLV